MGLEDLVQQTLGENEKIIYTNFTDSGVTNMASDSGLVPESELNDEYIVNYLAELTPSPWVNESSPNIVTQPESTGPIISENQGLTTINAADLSFMTSCATTPDNAGSFMSAMSPVSPSPSEVSTVSESSILDEAWLNVVSPPVYVECKKRGRKRKSEAGVLSSSTAPKQKKVKAYEINRPYDDKTLERKRLNAINAKRHRDMQKQEKKDLEQQLQDVTMERDNLKKQLETLQMNEQSLLNRMEAFKNQAFSLVSVFQGGH